MTGEKSFLKQLLYGPVLYNYLFLIFQLMYNFLFRDLLLDNTTYTIYEMKKTPLLGIVILTAATAGTYSIMMKCRILRSSGVKSPLPAAFALVVFNWVLSVHLVFTALQSFGIDVTANSEHMSGQANTAISLSILGVLIQSAVIAVFISRLNVPYLKTINMFKKISADITAFLFACVSYTVLWETIMYKSVSVNGKYNICTIEGGFNIFGWTLLFILLYPPMRFPYILQEMHDTSENSSSKMRVISYILVIITGVLPLIKINQ